MKRWLALLCLLALILSCVSVQGTTTFTQATTGNTIALTGVDFIKNMMTGIYTNDTVTDVNLQQRAGRTGTDGSPVAFTYPMHIEDWIGAYGARLYIQVYAWTATTATIQFNVTFFNGTMLNKNVVVTGLGKTNIASPSEVIINCTASQVTVFIGTTFSYRVNQSRAGMIYKSAVDNQYTFQNTKLTVGAASALPYYNFSIAGQQIVFNKNWRLPGNAITGLITFTRRAFFSITNSSIFNNYPSLGINVIESSGAIYATKKLYITDSLIKGYNKGKYSNISLTGDAKIKNSILDHVRIKCSVLETPIYLELENAVIENVASSGLGANVAVSSCVASKVFNCTYAINPYIAFFNITDMVFDDNTYLLNVQNANPIGFSGDINLINCVTDTYSSYGAFYSSGMFVKWMYTFNNKCIDDTSSNLSGVRIRVYNESNVKVIDTNTTANGNIPTRHIITHSWTKNLNTTNSVFRFVYTKPGYQTVENYATVNSAINWITSMDENETITLHQGLTNVTGTHQYSWNGTGFNVWANYSSPLVWFTNLVNCYGTHQNVWTGSQNNLYVNVTGNTSVGGGVVFQLINPNPADGTRDYNFIQYNSTGINTTIDLYCDNFSIPGRTINITYLTNYSGVWFPYGTISATSNGTYGVVNMGDFVYNNTKYWWNVSLEENGVYTNRTAFTFTTGEFTQIDQGICDDCTEYDLKIDEKARHINILGIANSSYYVMTAAGGTNYNGTLYTVKVCANTSSIIQHVIDTYVYSSTLSSGFWSSICWVTQDQGAAGDILALVHRPGGTTKSTIRTFRVWGSNGTIMSSTIDTLVLPLRTQWNNISHVRGEIYMVAGEDQTSLDGWLYTFSIQTSTGQISAAVNDSLEFDTLDASQIKLAHIDNDTMAVIYRTTGDDGMLKTYNVSATGDITNTVATQWEFDPANAGTPNLVHINGTVYSIAYSYVVPPFTHDSYVKTLRIHDNGTIIKTWISSLTMNNNQSDYITLFHIKNDTYGASYSNANEANKGQISIFNITYAGTLSTSTERTINFTDKTQYWSSIYWSPTSHINGWDFLVSWTNLTYAGWIKSVNLTFIPKVICVGYGSGINIIINGNGKGQNDLAIFVVVPVAILFFLGIAILVSKRRRNDGQQ